MSGPKILALDVETSPILAYVWGLFDQNIGIEQIHTDTSILSWCAKWVGEKEVFYDDQRNARDVGNDKRLLGDLWKLLNEAQVILTQNGKAFDEKRLNTRFILHGFGVPAPYKHIDTLKIAKRRFGFTSNKLAYLTDKLCEKYKKLSHEKYPGFSLWKECLNGNQDAWKEMEKYNVRDVLSLEELYTKLAPWDTSVNLAIYYTDAECGCGSKNLERRGFAYTKLGKYQRYQCHDCGAWFRDGKSLIESRGMKRSIRD